MDAPLNVDDSHGDYFKQMDKYEGEIWCRYVVVGKLSFDVISDPLWVTALLTWVLHVISSSYQRLKLDANVCELL